MDRTRKSRLGTTVDVLRAKNVPGYGLVDHFHGRGRVIAEATNMTEFLIEFVDGGRVWFTEQRLRDVTGELEVRSDAGLEAVYSSDDYRAADAYAAELRGVGAKGVRVRAARACQCDGGFHRPQCPVQS